MSNDTMWSDEEKGAVIAHHQSNIDKWKEQIGELNEQIASALYRIAELRGATTGYHSSMPLWKKVQYILAAEKTIMNTKEIARSIQKFEGTEYTDSKDIVSAISATINPKIKKGDTFNRTEIDGEHYYGLKEWFDENGTVYITYSNVYFL